MKDNFIHVCFVIDESGSMSSSRKDVIDGFAKVINEQKENKEGSCAISLYKFSNDVSKVYVGEDINNVRPLVDRKSWTYEIDLGWSNPIKCVENGNGFVGSVNSDMEECVSNISIDPTRSYDPHGGTAMYDGIGTAIDEIGKWLSVMDESDRPSKNLIVIMTDGEENSSRKYTAEKVKDMIKHQEEKYNWTFVYMGTDITTNEHADKIGIRSKAYNTRDDIDGSWSMVNAVTTSYRLDEKSFAESLSLGVCTMNEKYCNATGLNMNS